MFTLTTGANRVYLRTKQRFLHGLESLLLHSIPVTKQVAHAMKTRLVNVDGLSHNALSHMAGNSMHGASVGFMCLVAVKYSQPVP
jgi:hypothetical protein